MKINSEIRNRVVKSLSEAKCINSQELREKVYDAWALSLELNGYSSIKEMSFSGVPDVYVGKTGNRTQLDHLRGVTRIAVAIAKELTESFSDFRVNMDEVIAGGLCHDLGKPFEYNNANRERWKSKSNKMGNPSIRHPVYGVYIALTVGLPEQIVHIVGAHSMEGQYLERSLVAQIIHHADDLFWQILEKAGIVS